MHDVGLRPDKLIVTAATTEKKPEKGVPTGNGDFNQMDGVDAGAGAGGEGTVIPNGHLEDKHVSHYHIP